MGRKRRKETGGRAIFGGAGFETRKRDNSFYNIGEAGRAKYFCSKVAKVPSLRLAQFTVTC